MFAHYNPEANIFLLSNYYIAWRRERRKDNGEEIRQEKCNGVDAEGFAEDLRNSLLNDK